MLPADSTHRGAEHAAPTTASAGKGQVVVKPGRQLPRSEEPGRRLVSVERNFESVPYFVTKAHGRDTGDLVTEYCWSEVASDGTQVERHWRILATPRYGPPGPLDQDVYLAVVELLDRSGGMPADGTLAFTIYDLIRILGWANSGRAYERVKTSLKRMASTPIESEKAFYAAGLQHNVSDTFTLFSAHLSEAHDLFGGVSEGHRLVFSEYFRENYLEGFSRRLDCTTYWRLQAALPRRLYRLIESERVDGARRGRRRAASCAFDVFDLARRLPLARTYTHPSKIKQALGRAHEDLLGAGYLHDVYYDGAKKRPSVHYEVERASARFMDEGDPLEGLDGNQRRAASALAGSGLAMDLSRSLVEAHGAARCREAVSELADQERRTGVRNPAGWLRSVLERSGSRRLGQASRAAASGPPPDESPCGRPAEEEAADGRLF